MFRSIPAALVATLAVPFLSAHAADKSRLDDLIAAIAGDNEPARSEARRLIVREDPLEAADKLLPLLASDKHAVWSAAFQTLLDLEAMVGQAGFEHQRVEMTGGIMSLLSADQPEVMKLRALRLLPIVIPDGYDLSPMAALLDDEKLREKALTALEETRTHAAAVVIADQLVRADPRFQCALLDSLAQLKDRKTLPTIESAARSPDAHVRAAALYALSWGGSTHPDYIKLADRIVASADAETRAAALDAQFRMINAIGEVAKQRTDAQSLWLGMLKRPDAVITNAALAGLSRCGDGSSVAPMLAAIKDAEPRTWSIGIASIGAMGGADIARAIVDAYSQQPAATQLALIPILGARHDAGALDVLRSAAESSDLAMRVAGLRAVADAGLPQGGEILARAAESGNRDLQALARRAMVTLAANLRVRGLKQEAGRLYARAFALTADDKELCREVAEGVTLCPVAEAYEAAKAGATRQELKDLSARMLLAVGAALKAANQNEKALELYKLVRDSKPSTEVVQDLARQMSELDPGLDLRGLLGTITQWWVVGPFELGEHHEGWSRDYIGEESVSLAGRYMSGKSRVAWKPSTSREVNGKIDLRKTIASQEHAIGYAYTQISVPEATDALLLLGVDDSEKVWVNGQKVFELFTPRGLQCDQDKIPIKLKAGTNTILLKIWQHTQGWEFCARLSLPDGHPLSFTQAKP